MCRCIGQTKLEEEVLESDYCVILTCQSKRRLRQFQSVKKSVVNIRVVVLQEIKGCRLLFDTSAD